MGTSCISGSMYKKNGAAKSPEKDLPYRIFQVELTDLENGDRGEEFYYMEKENYVK